MNWISCSTPLRTLSKDGSIHVTNEFWSTWIAVIGAVVLGTGCTLLLQQASLQQQRWPLFGFTLYTIGTINLFGMSVLHHGVDADARTEELFRLLDYCAIFLMIAGSQAAFCMTLMRNPAGWTLFGVEWTLAILGIFLKTACPRVPKKITTGIYLLMGWLGVFVIPSLYAAAGWPALALLAAGGVIYTVGSAVFMCERPNPWPGTFGFHEIWHLMVLVAMLCHFALIYFYLLPLSS
jgi:hemolysin III